MGMINTPHGMVDMAQFTDLIGGGASNPYMSPADAAGLIPAPRAFRALQQPPQPFSGMVANTLYQVAAPMIAHAMGYQNATWAPQLGRGMSAFDAGYSSAFTTPANAVGMQRASQLVARQMGGGFAAVADRAGARDWLAPDMSSTEFRTAITNGASGQFGQLAAQFAAYSPIMQELSGGNPLEAFQRMSRAGASSMTPAGAIRNIMDGGELNTLLPMQIAEHRSELFDTLHDAAYGYDYTDPKTGKTIRERSLTPNMDFTQGFRVEDAIGGLTEYMSRRGFEYMTDEGLQTYGGSDTSKQREMQGAHLKVLAAAREVFQSDDMGELTANLEQLTQGNIAHIDPDRIIATLDKMSATATALGMEGAHFMEVALDTQNMLGGTVGLGLGGGAGSMRSASGRILGGLGAPDLTHELTTQATVMASLNGDMSAAGIKDMSAKQMSLLNLGLSSVQGKDIQLIEWMQQSGMIDEDLYSSYNKSIAEADKQGQEVIARDIMRDSPFGSLQAARTAMSDPNFRIAIGKDSDKRTWRNTVRNIQDAMTGELPERTRQVTVQRGREHVELLSAMSGIRIPQGGAPDQARVDAMVEAITSAGGTDDQIQLVKDQYARNKMAGVRQVLAGEDYERFRGAAEQKGQDAYNQAARTWLEAQGGARHTGLRAELRKVAGTLGRTATSDENTLISNAHIALNAGDADAASLTVAQFKAGMSNAERGSVDTAGQAARDRYKQVGKHVEDTNTVLDIEQLFLAQPDITIGALAQELGKSPEEIELLLTQHNLSEIQAGTQSGLAGGPLALKQLAGATAARRAITEQANDLAPKLESARNKFAKYRRSPIQVFADWATGKNNTSFADVLGIRVTELSEEDKAKLSDEERTEYEARISEYAEGKKLYGDMTVDTVQNLTDQQIDKKYGAKASEIKSVRDKLNEEQIQEMKLSPLLAPITPLTAAIGPVAGWRGKDSAPVEREAKEQKQASGAKHATHQKPVQMSGTVVLTSKGGKVLGMLDVAQAMVG
jgi:hypothetical protein